MIYILTFLVSSAFVWIGTRECTKRKMEDGMWETVRLKKIPVLIGLLLPALLASMRAVSVGSDVSFYVVPLFNKAINSNSFSDYVAILGGDIESLINQTYKVIEIILVDDGSKDQSGMICDQYANLDSRIKVIHKQNGGLSAARNTGYNHSKYEWLMFVDGDDYVDNNFCYAMLNAAIQYDVDLVMCGMYKDYGKTREKYTYYIPANVKFEKKDCIWLQEQLLHFDGNIATAYCKLINKKVLSTYNITHNENLRQGAEGLEFNIRLFEKIDSAVFIGEWLYHYIYNENSISAKHDEANHKYVLNCFRVIKNQVQESHNKTELMKWFDNRLLYVVITTAISGYFSPSNKEPFRCKCDKFRKYLKNDMVDTALRSNNTQGLSNERKVMLFCIKHNMFVALQVFAFLRNLQKKIK